MKTIVIYNSSTGFTKQYAEWISQELGCEITDNKSIKDNQIYDYDCVIFGGWVMGNTVMGLERMRKLTIKNLVVFAVGATPMSEEIVRQLKDQNKIEDWPFYYFEGGFHFNKLKLPLRVMLNMIKKSLKNKENRTSQDEYMARVLGTSYDNSNKKYISEIVEYVKSI